MNRLVPDWFTEDNSRPSHDDLHSITNQKKPTRVDADLVELLWQNGHVVTQSQNQRKPQGSQRQELGSKCIGSLVNSANLVQEYENAPWYRYPLDESLDKEIFGDFFYEAPIAVADGIGLNSKPSKDTTIGVKHAASAENSVLLESASRSCSGLSVQEHAIPNNPAAAVSKDFVLFEGDAIPHTPNSTLIRSSSVPSLASEGNINFSNVFPKPAKFESSSVRPTVPGNQGVVEIGDCSSLKPIGSSVCSSNKIQNRVELSQTLSNDVNGVARKQQPYERFRTNNCEVTIASSSDASGSSFGKTGQQSTSNQSSKRKGRDREESEYHSEDAEFESFDAHKPEKRAASTRRSRAAEVHNLSERRRRDRINEKMRALQELIPHCNKSDKASMLDEAIEYLKSLQLQVQMMWMGSGMAPMMFPGIQQYMSRMSMGMALGPMPSLHGAVQLPSNPIVTQPLPTSSPLSSLNLPNQLRNICLPETYAQFLGFQNMQQPPQSVNLYAYGSRMAQQNQPSATVGNSSPNAGAAGAPSQNIQKMN